MITHILRFHGIHCNYSGSQQFSDIENEQGEYFFQERAYFPWSWLKESKIRYWATRNIFHDRTEAYRAAKQWGAITVEEGFYCEPDDMHYFLIFDDMDKCAAFVAEKLGVKFEWLSQDKPSE